MTSSYLASLCLFPHQKGEKDNGIQTHEVDVKFKGINSFKTYTASGACNKHAVNIILSLSVHPINPSLVSS